MRGEERERRGGSAELNGNVDSLGDGEVFLNFEMCAVCSE